MLRVAVPNKGSLSDTAAQMLEEAGYPVRREAKELTVTDRRNGVEFFYLRPRDIATYVGSGALDVGITGRDLLLDSRSAAIEIASLDFAGSTLRFAAPAGQFESVEQLEGKRVATSFPGLVGAFLATAGVNAELIALEGAVESAVKLGVADAIADVVETGTTLRQQGLHVFGPVIVESTAVLIGRSLETPGLEVLLRRFQGVLVARQYVLMDYDLPVRFLEEATRIAPGVESPTVSPLRDTDWVAVRVMVRKPDTNSVMDRLYDLGARAILVSPIHAARI
ncbi:MAG: ATP phosphoribosyltransferase [Microbacteriaceae bacterium]